MKEFITVATFNFAYEITVLKSILTNEGIAFFFQNENLIAIDPFSSFAYGGIDLKVHPNDKDLVLEIIDSLNRNLDIV